MRPLVPRSLARGGLVACLALAPSCAREAPSPAPSPAPPAAAPPAAPFFEDVTERSGVDFVHDNGAEGRRFVPETMGSGGCALDADGDGHLDLFLVQSGPVPGSGSARAKPPNRLWRNRGDGTFEDVSEASGAGDTGYGMGATCADHDGDGDTDIFVVAFGPDVLLENDGRGRFTDVTRAAGLRDDLWGSSATFLDADQDGDLDLHVVNYLDFTVATHVPCRERGEVEAYCHPDVRGAASDTYWENRGDGTYLDATDRAGLRETTGKGLGVIALDHDDDGDPDLLVTNDTTPNFLWRNDGAGRFTEVGLAEGVAFSEEGRALAGMGVDAGDVDGDGRLDVVVINFAGEPNSLFVRGARAFRHAGRRLGVHGPSLPVLGFGCDFLDVDLDGDLDLFVANGHIIDNIAEVDRAQSHAQPAQLFLNRGDGRLDLLSAAETGSPARPAVGRGTITWDPDDDGRLDVVVTACGGRVRLHRNARPAAGHWAGFLLRREGGNRDAIGARVTVEAGARRWMDERRAGSSYQTSGDPRLHFGLGAAARIDRVTVRWSATKVETHEGLEVDRYYLLHEGRAPEVLAP